MSTEPNTHFEAIVKGLVQGVHFRYFTQQEARRLGVTGWVSNQPNGTVKVIAEGEKATLERFLTFLHHGPPSARVEEVEISWSAATNTFTEFKVHYL